MSKSTNDPILRKLSDGRTVGQKDESNFIGRCRLTSNIQNWMALVNHVLCSKEIKIIPLVLLYFRDKVMLEKVENDVSVASKKRLRLMAVLQFRFHMEKPRSFMEVLSPL